MAKIKRTHSLDFDLVQSDIIVAKVRTNRTYAQNLYAALCNTAWQEQDPWYILQGKTWSCTWRHAGAIVADIMGSGDYLDWYCSGMMVGHPNDDLINSSRTDIGYIREGDVTPEIQHDLAEIGWRTVVD